MVSQQGFFHFCLEAFLYDAITYSLGCRKSQDRNCYHTPAIEGSPEIWCGKSLCALSHLHDVAKDGLNPVCMVRCLTPQRSRLDISPGKLPSGKVAPCTWDCKNSSFACVLTWLVQLLSMSLCVRPSLPGLMSQEVPALCLTGYRASVRLLVLVKTEQAIVCDQSENMLVSGESHCLAQAWT